MSIQSHRQKRPAVLKQSGICQVFLPGPRGSWASGSGTIHPRVGGFAGESTLPAQAGGSAWGTGGELAGGERMTFEFWLAQDCQGSVFSLYWVLWCSVQRDLLLWGRLVPSSCLGKRSCAFPSSSWRRSFERSAGVLPSPTVGGPGLSAHPTVATAGDPSGGAWDCWQGRGFVFSRAKFLTPTVLF